MSRAGVFKWHKRFSEGLAEIDDDKHPGRRTNTSKTNENIDRINDIFRNNLRISI